MKKFLFPLTAALVLGMASCSNQASTTEDEKKIQDSLDKIKQDSIENALMNSVTDEDDSTSGHSDSAEHKTETAADGTETKK